MSDKQPHTNVSSAPHADNSGGHDAHSLAHPMPLKILGGVLAALLFLTWLTVAATWWDLGPWNIWIALLIAAVKGGLVALFFMHLRYDSPFHGVILLAALLFVAIFIAITLTDTTNYQQMMEVPATLLLGS